MHYPPYAFSATGQPTILAPKEIGQRTGLSATDIKTVQWAYSNCTVQQQIQCATNTAGGVLYADVGRMVVVEFSAFFDGGAILANYEVPTGSTLSPSTASLGTLRTNVSWQPTSAALGAARFRVVYSSPSTLATTECSQELHVVLPGSSCWGAAANPSTDCSGHGFCGPSGPFACTCYSGWWGAQCENAVTTHCPEETLPVYLGFDDSLGSDLLVWGFQSDSAVTTTVSQKGAGSLQISPSESQWTGIGRDFRAVGGVTPTTVSCFIRVSATVKTAAVEILDLTLNSVFSFAIVNGAWVLNGRTLSKVEVQRWYHVDLRLDYFSRTTSVYLDGTLLTLLDWTIYSSYGSTGAITFRSFTAFSNTWFDEVLISCTTDPVSPLVTPASPSPSTCSPGTATVPSQRLAAVVNFTSTFPLQLNVGTALVYAVRVTVVLTASTEVSIMLAGPRQNSLQKLLSGHYTSLAVTFDDAATTEIPSAQNVAGVFRPQTSLQYYLNSGATGTWSLTVSSARPATLTQWEIQIDVGCCTLVFGTTAAVQFHSATTQPVTVVARLLTVPEYRIQMIEATGPMTAALRFADCSGTVDPLVNILKDKFCNDPATQAVVKALSSKSTNFTCAVVLPITSAAQTNPGSVASIVLACALGAILLTTGAVFILRRVKQRRSFEVTYRSFPEYMPATVRPQVRNQPHTFPPPSQAFHARAPHLYGAPIVSHRLLPQPFSKPTPLAPASIRVTYARVPQFDSPRSISPPRSQFVAAPQSFPNRYNQSL
eukprot:TRINITY_DN13264_c0_g1_i2.p1 TRINITY_DN13264_c0_g1~~TRINITY_DN13264_c0_g1_i2.p1  ORF type:complete len:768 (+),score=61.46 TRINITY_DN13264_c0_g1_i2:590-2893(+)